MRTDVASSAIAEALERQSLVLFIGADLPRVVTGLPSRADLAHDLARRYRLDESLPLAEVAQWVSQAGNRFEFTDFLRDALDTAGKSPQPFHRRIVALVKEHQVEMIVTTAYDDLLERAFQQAGIGFNRVVRGSDVSFIRPDRPTLIKLYGDVSQPDTLVVTDRDHTALLRDREREPLLDEVRLAFRRNTVLFLGYNLADPDFRFLFDPVAESRFAHTAYAVWPGLPEADVRMWRDGGIAILAADPLGALSASAAPAPAAPQPQPTVALPSGGSQATASVAIGGNVSGSVIIVGDGNVVGDGSSSRVVKGQAPAEAGARPGPTVAQWNTAAIRDLLNTAFNDEELTTLCFDYFRPVYEEFAGGMSKGQKVQRLLDYCIRQEQVEDLLAAVRKANPKQYQRFEGQLKG